MKEFILQGLLVQTGDTLIKATGYWFSFHSADYEWVLG